MITPAQKAFFETFGFLHLPGLLGDLIAWIQSEFVAVWAARPDVKHDGSQRTMFPASFIDTRERLCTLLDEPRIDDLATSLLGEGWGYYGGDGNLYAGDTGWHCDAVPGDYGGVQAKRVVRHLKIAFYLDPVGRDTGALRVIPGSHRWMHEGYETA